MLFGSGRRGCACGRDAGNEEMMTIMPKKIIGKHLPGKERDERRIILRLMLERGQEVGRIGLGLCPVMVFGIRGVEFSSFDTS
jgi:hypothetical protein